MKNVFKKLWRRDYSKKMAYVKFIFDQMQANDIYYFKDDEVEIRRAQKVDLPGPGEDRGLLSI